MEKHLVKFTEDTSITFVAQILDLGFHIGASIIIVRTLGPEGQGIYFLAILLPSFLLTFCNLGVAPSSIFYIGKKKYPVKEIIGNNVILSIFLGIIGFLIGLIIILFFSNSLFQGVARIYLFLALILLPLFLFVTFVNYVFLGLQKIKEFNSIIILQKFVFLILLSICLLIFKLGLKATIGANILSYLIIATILIYFIRKIIGVFKLKFNKFYIKNAFGYGFKVYISNIISFFHYRIGAFLINIFLNPIAVGFYSVAIALAEKLWLFSQSAGMVLFPKVSSETDEKRLKEFTPFVCRNVLLIAAIAAILLFFFGPLLITLFYSKKFLSSILPFQILLVGTVPMSGWQILANDLYGRGKPKLNIYISLTSVMLNIILNILLIPKFGIVGAAWATSVSYTFAFLAIAILYSRVSGNSISKIIFAQRSDLIFYKEFMDSVFQRLMPSR